MRILLAEHDEPRRATMALLRAGGFTVERAGRGEDALEMARLAQFDAVVVDAGVPGMSGMEVIRRLRGHEVAAPALLVADAVPRAVRIAAFEAGADDCVARPLDGPEVIARLHAIVRRSRGFGHRQISVRNIVMDHDARNVLVNGQRVHLTGKEFALLELLMLRCGRVVPKWRIIDHLYAGADEPSSRTVEVFLCGLRKKIDPPPPAPSVIRTIPGQGYIFESDSPAVPEAPRPRARPVWPETPTGTLKRAVSLAII